MLASFSPSVPLFLCFWNCFFPSIGLLHTSFYKQLASTAGACSTGFANLASKNVLFINEATQATIGEAFMRGITRNGREAAGKRLNHADLLHAIVSLAAVRILLGMLSTSLVSTSGTGEK